MKSILKTENNSKLRFTVLSVLIALVLIQSIRIISAQSPSSADFSGNNSRDQALLVKEGWYTNINISSTDDEWLKFETGTSDLIEVAIYYNESLGSMSMEFIDVNDTVIFADESEGLYDFISYKLDETRSPTSFLKISATMNTTYDLFINITTYGDAEGFFISDEYLDQGYVPNTLLLIVAYMAMAATIVLWVEFGFSFIGKGRKSDNVAQGSYYKGLGFFIVSVAISESAYLLDLFNRDVNDSRLFLEDSKYPDPFTSIVNVDYYVVAFIMVLIGLAFLMYPMESYLYSHKKKVFTITITACIPLPLIIRLIEANHTKLGLDLADDSSFDYQMISILWGVVILIGVLAMIYLFKLYIDLGRKAPKGSKLRKKSRYIIYGLVLWLSSIFSSSSIVKEVSKITSDYGPNGVNAVGSMGAFIQGLHIYPIFPFIIPLFLLISLRLLISGFTRDY